MIHAVIDTNVLVSVLLAKSEDSSVIKLIDAVLNGKIIPLFNNEIVAEYTEVLSRPKFNFDKENARTPCGAYSLSWRGCR